MRIRSLDIKGLWHLYDLHLDFDEYVNILSGSNGAGKTTILNIIAALCSTSNRYNKILEKVEKVTIDFDDDNRVIFVNFRDTISKLQEKASQDEVYQDIWNDLDKKLDDDDRRNMSEVSIHAAIRYREEKGINKPIGKWLHSVKLDIINSFDASMPATYDSKRLGKMKEEEGVESALDFKLYDLQSKYAFYLGDLSNRLEQIIVSKKQAEWYDLQEVYQRKNTFMSIVDDMFKETGKRLNRDASRLEFIAEDGETHLTVYQLSAGEKQVIFILLTVLLQEGNPFILLMDEPEISLHVDWQQVLIGHIRDLNPACQIISSSHAPYLIVRGWQDTVIQIDDIKTKSNNENRFSIIEPLF